MTCRDRGTYSFGSVQIIPSNTVASRFGSALQHCAHMSTPASCEGGLTKFSSSEGRKYCRNTLRCLLPHDTHDFQLDAIGHLLDGQDTLLITATGSGKTDTFIRLMHLISYISAHPNEIPGIIFPPDPAMIIVCPTKTLEEEMVRIMGFWQNNGTYFDFPGRKNEKMWPRIIGH